MPQDRETLNERDVLPGVFDPDADTSAPEPESEVAADEPEGNEGTIDVQGTMRWAEFNRRNEEIKRERVALEAERRDLQARNAGYQDYEEFTRTIQANPALAQDIRSAFERHAPTVRPASVVSPEVEILRKELKQELEEVRNDRVERAADRIKSEVDRLRTENKLTVEEANNVMYAALKEGDIGVTTPRDKIGRVLRMTYRDLAFEKAKGKGERELAEKLREGQRAASPGGKPKGSQDDDALPVYDAKMSYEQIAAAEIKRLNLTRR